MKSLSILAFFVLATPFAAHAKKIESGQLYFELDAKKVGPWHRDKGMRNGFFSPSRTNEMKKYHPTATARLLESHKALLGVYEKAHGCWPNFRLVLVDLAVGMTHNAGTPLIGALRPVLDAVDAAPPMIGKGGRRAVLAALQSARTALAEKANAQLMKNIDLAISFAGRSCGELFKKGAGPVAAK
jgi:hypothetical protein